MTSEVLIMNERGIAVAADSAAFSNGKIFKANKLFELTPDQPIGVMIYGANTISTVPFDIFVGEYRARLGGRRFDRLSDCAKDFMSFIEKGGATSLEGNPIITQGYRDAFVIQALLALLRAYDGEITRLSEEMSQEDDDVDFDKLVETFLEGEREYSAQNVDQGGVEGLIDWLERAIERENATPYLETIWLWSNQRTRERIMEILSLKVASH